MARALCRMDVIVVASVDRIQERSDSGVDVLLMSSFSTGVIGAFEHTTDAREEGRDGVMGVLVAGVVW